MLQQIATSQAFGNIFDLFSAVYISSIFFYLFTDVMMWHRKAIYSFNKLDEVFKLCEKGDFDKLDEVSFELDKRNSIIQARNSFLWLFKKTSILYIILYVFRYYPLLALKLKGVYIESDILMRAGLFQLMNMTLYISIIRVIHRFISIISAARFSYILTNKETISVYDIFTSVVTMNFRFAKSYEFFGTLGAIAMIINSIICFKFS